MKIRAFLTILTFIFTLQIIFAACDYNVDEINVKSGSFNLANVINEPNIYIKGDLSTNPLTIELIFNNSQSGCFVQEDFKLKLFSTSPQMSPNSVVEENNITKVTFAQAVNVVQTTQFTSVLTIKTLTRNLNFIPDNTNPVLSITPNLALNNTLVGPNTLIEYQVYAQDAQSGILSITSSLGGFVTEQNSRNVTITTTFNTTPSSTTIGTVTVMDKLGNTVSESFKVSVDSSAPQIETVNSKKFDKTYTLSGSTRYVNIKNIKITDESFSILGLQNSKFQGDFSSFTLDSNLVDGTCQYFNSQDYVECSFTNIPINLNRTQTHQFSIILTDSLGNNQTYNFNEEIFYDTSGPNIDAFYLRNGLGIDNIFSSYDNKTYVFLKFSDESFEKVEGLGANINVNFDIIPFPQRLTNPSKCQKNGTNAYSCLWELGNDVDVFSSDARKEIPFTVTISDVFGNPNSMSINLTLDNEKPKLLGIHYESVEDIKTGLVKSQDRVIFKLDTQDSNLQDKISGLYMVGGDFDQFTGENDFDSIENITINNFFNDNLDCGYFNSTTTRCEIEQIARNGHLNTTSTIYLMDAAGNYEEIKIEIEILKRANESIEIFTVTDTNKFNSKKEDRVLAAPPINRNLLIDGSGESGAAAVDIWFTGKMDYINEEDKLLNFSLLNYQLKGCNMADSQNPFTLGGEVKFYPENIIIVENQSDYEFAIRLNLLKSSNVRDLNDFNVNCSLVLTKRDSYSVYGLDFGSIEQINFTGKISFYDIPRGGITKAQAEKILELYDDMDLLGVDFSSIYDIYKIFSGICTTIYGASGVISSASNVMTAVSTMLEGNPYTYPAGNAIGTAKDKTQGTFSDMLHGLTKDDSMFKKMCDYVTCENGKTILGIFTDGKGPESLPGVGTLYQFQSDLAQNFCPATQGYEQYTDSEGKETYSAGDKFYIKDNQGNYIQVSYNQIQNEYKSEKIYVPDKTIKGEDGKTQQTFKVVTQKNPTYNTPVFESSPEPEQEETNQQDQTVQDERKVSVITTASGKDIFYFESESGNKYAYTPSEQTELNNALANPNHQTKTVTVPKDSDVSRTVMISRNTQVGSVTDPQGKDYFYDAKTGKALIPTEQAKIDELRKGGN